jgi:hypothetical protein
MTYDARESSIADGEPFECYEFVTPLGTFRYTSLPEDVTLGGNLYVVREGIGRTEADINSVVDSLQTMDFLIPRDDPLATGFNKRNLPDYCTTRVYRAHYGEDLSTEYTVEWRGEATGYGYSDAHFVISTQSILQAKVQGSQSTIYTQLSCNHRVYDDQCAVVQADHTFSAVVTDVTGIEILIDDQTFSDTDLALGQFVNDRTGEVRTIFSASTGLITVTYPFVDLVVGDTVSLSRGCNNLMSTCIARFDNVARFLGFRYMPGENLWLTNGNKIIETTTTNRNYVDPGLGPASIKYV